MDLSSIAKKLGLSDSKLVILKAAELRRLSNLQFDSSVIGVGEVAKAIICVEISATRLRVLFDRSCAMKLSGLSERAYIRSYNSLHNGLGVKVKLEVRELAIQFGCVRIIPYIRDGLKLYKDRFLSSLPASRRASVDYTRPVFTAVAFYLCTKKQKLSSYKKRKQMEKYDYEKWKSSVLASNNQNKTEACKQTKQSRLNFLKETAETQKLEAV